MKRADYIQALTGSTQVPVKEQSSFFAPSNIALCKYWGKRQKELNLPVNSSLSISLGTAGTKTKLCLSTTDSDEVYLNNHLVSKDHEFYKRIVAYLDLLGTRPSLLIETENNIPTAAGVASSASGFAALVKALNDFFGWQLSLKELSQLARVGSGSASRSIFEGFVSWHAGVCENGSDSFAEPLNVSWPDFRIALIPCNLGPKSVGSTEGMNRTIETSELYAGWPNKVKSDFSKIEHAIYEQDFSSLGPVVESNAMSMHGTMLGAKPPVIYFQDTSLASIVKIHQLRSKGLEIYFTMDAGPNVKIIFLVKDLEKISEYFPDIQIFTPFESTN
ncbi:MAG: diphosphomevalonate decarboxylase [Lentisphaeria bacterium]|nr:diphosphomevalonate decarboxylase [Lentisphaeria bacterium]